MKRIFGTVLTFCFILLLTGTFASADDFILPGPFYVVSVDGSRVFHVTPEASRWQAETADWADFPPTGLYYNTYPLTPIYLVENLGSIVWEQDLFFSQNMQHFAWVPITNALDHRFDASDTTALVFYANGTIQKTYMVSDLVGDLDAVRWTNTTAQWRNLAVTIFDMENNRLTIETIDHEIFVFDITTGEVINTAHNNFVIFLAIGIVILLGGITALIVRRRHAGGKSYPG